uniref:LarA-like N-terminal domain-containing protein n=1 Tax=Corethron hystrix TaxID=216773 RepID=A0A7S1B7C9_9STRA|mmetsp:Transcript_15868/g.35729  ORF Transcript_15868/g.35729 Transcript_15868/m.35729 type:complete len:507 (+) Transcript_15868:323-1843(+)
MMKRTQLFFKNISSTLSENLREYLCSEKVMLLPPDYTRYHSRSGDITRFVHDFYHGSPALPPNHFPPSASSPPHISILPALGTHAPMTRPQIRSMFGDTIADAVEDESGNGSEKDTDLIVHDWRSDVITIGHVPSSLVSTATRGFVCDTSWPAQLNRHVWEGRHDLVLSIGQVVPHEVTGMANYNKNIFVGIGGADAINLSHFIGAVAGMENLMGTAENPLRNILQYASENFLGKLPLWYILTVMGAEAGGREPTIRGVFIGNTAECYRKACELSLRQNFKVIDEPLQNMVVYLDPDEYHSTWLGNKSIYRTRMAIKDGGSLIVIAPGVRKFGEDDLVDALIRKHGYRGTPQALEDMKSDVVLRSNLGVVAHLIHGSSEGRFEVTYCPRPQLLSREEVNSVGFKWGDIEEMCTKYSISLPSADGGGLPILPDDGQNISTDGTLFYFICNPAMGLWASRDRLEGQNMSKDRDSHDSSPLDDAVEITPPQDAHDGSGGLGGWIHSPPL